MYKQRSSVEQRRLHEKVGNEQGRRDYEGGPKHHATMTYLPEHLLAPPPDHWLNNRPGAVNAQLEGKGHISPGRRRPE